MKGTHVAAQPSHFTRADAETFLFEEAELLDSMKLEDWLKLFTSDGLYWIPIDDTEPVGSCASIVRDDTLRREERVFHLLHTYFPAQSPPSRTLHMIANVRVEQAASDRAIVRSNQTIHEVRTGDYRQTGLGLPTTLVARVEHTLRFEGGAPRIAQKKILLLNRDMPLGNLTYLL